MAFPWQQTIQSGTPIESVDIKEIRSAVDYVDNKKCYTHYVSYYSEYRSPVHTSDYWPYYSSNNDSVDSSDCSSVCSSNNSDVNGTYYGFVL